MHHMVADLLNKVVLSARYTVGILLHKHLSNLAQSCVVRPLVKAFRGCRGWKRQLILQAIRNLG